MNTSLFPNNIMPPWQFNCAHKEQTIHWNGTDTVERYEKNMQKSSTRDLLHKLGWIDSVVEYAYNSHGYRCKEFDSRPCALALGCSFTEGIGLHTEQTWPHMLASMLDLTVWNLGSGGASIDTVFRILEYYIDSLKPKFIFLLIPPEPRFEYCDIDNGFPIIQISTLGRHESFAKEWLSQSFNGIYNTKKTMLAMEQICAKSNVPLFACSSIGAMDNNTGTFNWNHGHVDLARDLMHPGELYQKYIATVMYSQHQKNIEVATS
jgi:hypothetical protein